MIKQASDLIVTAEKRLETMQSNKPNINFDSVAPK